jgi:hypothetical protein
MPLLKMQVNGEETRAQVYSIGDLLKIIQIKQKVIEVLTEQNEELRRKLNGEVNGVDQEGREPGGKVSK